MRPFRATMGVVLAAALALSACGGSSATSGAAAAKPKANGVDALAPQAIVDKAEAAAKSARSVHISGRSTSGGQTFGIDMRVAGTRGAQGSITLSGAHIEVLRIDTDAYIKADQAFWSQLGDAALAAKLEGKYVKGSTADPQFQAFTDFTDITKIFNDLLSPKGTLTKVSGKDVSGSGTVGVKDGDKTDGGTLYVATTGQPYPLLIEPNAGTGDSGSITLAEWNQPVTLVTPPAAQVLDLSDLGG